jgi:hypothetical protein
MLSILQAFRTRTRILRMSQLLSRSFAVKLSRATSSNTQQFVTATAYVSLLCCTVAFAQSTTPTRDQTVKPSHNIPKAPVGHRQPSPRDISAAKGNDDIGLLGEDADDKALDRKIKSICRGCF